jgi:hypothetical protein
MDQADIKILRPRRNKQQLLDLLAAYDQTTGVSIKDFCKRHKVTEGSFYTARKRHRGVTVSKNKSTGFISIKRPAFDQSTGTLFAEVKGIKFYQPVPVDYLKALIL